jgi:hypothetical protein
MTAALITMEDKVQSKVKILSITLIRGNIIINLIVLIMIITIESKRY